MPDAAPPPEPDPGLQQEIIRSTQWLLNLRWAPAVALSALPWLVPLVPGLALASWPLSACGLTLLVANALLHLLYRRWLSTTDPDLMERQSRQARLLLWLQIAIDWSATLVALHWSGGLTSPLLLLLLVHLSITSVLLARRECLLLALTGVVLVLALGFAQELELVGWHPLVLGQVPPGTLVIMAIGGCFSLVAFSLSWLSSTLSLRLSRRGLVIQRLSRNLETAYNQLMAQYALTRETSTILDLDRLLATLTEKVAGTLGVMACLIHLREEGSEGLRFAAGWGIDEEGSWLRRPPQGGGLFGEIFAGRSVFLADTGQSDDDWAAALAAGGWLSLAGAPIRGRKGVIGVLWTTCRRVTRLGEDDARFLEAAGNQAGVAIENAMAWSSMQELDRKKTQFVNLVTHELRSPVAVTLSLLDVLAGGCAGELTEKQTELVRRAKNRTEFLRTLVDDLLAMAESKALPRTTLRAGSCDLVQVVRRIFKRHETLAQGKGQEYLLDLPGEGELPVLAAPDALDRIMTNLISNGIKYTPEGGRVTVAVEDEGEWRTVRVRDTGIGIPAAAIPQLGQDFYRAPNARQLEPTGTGLGLAITANLIDALRGSLDIESEEGRGSTFTVRFRGV